MTALSQVSPYPGWPTEWEGGREGAEREGKEGGQEGEEGREGRMEREAVQENG